MTSLVGNYDTAAPFSAVVFITATFADGYAQIGSGAVVGGNDVLTASHMVWSAAHGAATRVTVIPGYDNGASPFGSYQAKLWNYNEWDVDRDGLATQAESGRDVAILGFSERLSDKTASFGLDAGYAGGAVHVSGYPAKYADQTSGLSRLTDDTGSGYEQGGVFNLNSDIEVNPGNSGGPVWYQDGAGAHLVGVVSTKLWAADLATNWKQIQDWMSGNDYLLSTQSTVVPDYIAKIARLYEAALDRPFEQQGLNHWIGQHDQGMSFTEMAHQFLDSQEFTARFGDDDHMSNETFVTRMYANVLNRAPEKAGFDYWVDNMKAGMTHEQVLLGFSESVENLNQSTYLNKLHQVSPGVWDI